MARDKPFRDMLRLAIRDANGDKLHLRVIAEALVERASAGDVAAIKEVADRIDGKVAQPHAGADEDDGGPVKMVIEWKGSSTSPSITSPADNSLGITLEGDQSVGPASSPTDAPAKP